MKQSLLILALAGVAAGATAQVHEPEPGRYYRIQHASGGYLTDNGFNAEVLPMVEDNSQIVRFIPVEGKANTYNIERVKRHQFYGSDGSWSTAIISRNIPLSQFVVEPVDSRSPWVMIKNVGHSNENKKALGMDANDTKVYTDKSGTDALLHQWQIVEAELYPETETPDDVYPDNNIPDTDPRANVYPGYKLVFAEEFSGEGKPSADIWNFETGFMRNQEHQYYYGNKNTYIQDGVLVIEARDVLDRQLKNPKYTPGNNSWPSNIGKYIHWTSGSMTTKGGWNSGYTWKYGIYEVRAKVPQINGCWPAIWSTGKQYEWPYGGEIDILEYYGNCIHGNVAWGNGARWGAKWNSKTVHDNVLGPGWGDEYHIWRMYWDYDHMELWCDDILVNNIDLNSTVNAVPADSFDHGNGANPFRDVRQMLWLNLAIGGQNGGDPTNPPYPCRFIVDYARVYQQYGTDGKATYHVDSEVSEPTFSYADGQINPDNSAVETIGADDEEFLPIAYYNLQGLRIETPAKGQLVIARQGTKSAKLIYND